MIYGDTANSNGNYGTAEREIRNVVVSFGGTDYTGTFESAQTPEPATLGLLLIGGLALLRRKVR